MAGNFSMREVVSKAFNLALLEVCQLVALALRIHAIGGICLCDDESDEDLCKLPLLMYMSLICYSNSISIDYVPTTMQTADILIKVLSLILH